MTTPVTSMTNAGSTGGKGAQQGQKAPPKPYPFPVGVYESCVQDYDNTVVLGATTAAWTSPTQLPIWNVSPTGWLRGCWFDFTLFFASGNAAGAFAANGPWSLVQNVTLYDLGGEVVIVLLGYEWMIMNKFGGYFEIGDPRGDLSYVANPAAGNSQGSPAVHYVMWLPLEAVQRDALGVVQNESKPGWKIIVNIDTAANTVGIGGTGFTAAAVNPSIRLKGFLESYTEPAAAAPNGRPFAQTPPLPGTLQYWKDESATLPASSTKYDLTNGVGFPLRNIMYIAYDVSSGTRATGDTDWPDPATLLIGNVNFFTRGKNLWITKIGKGFGFAGFGGTGIPGPDTAQGRENGVFPVWFTSDILMGAGNELRFKYIDTQVNTLVRFTGTFAASVNFYALTNWLATPSQNRYALIAG
jgi:hypothetical protein